MKLIKADKFELEVLFKPTIITAIRNESIVELKEDLNKVFIQLEKSNSIK